MSRIRQSILCLAAVVVAVAAQAQSDGAVSLKASSTTNNLLPNAQSPVNFFRQLLQMPPAERNQSLASRTPESRARIQAKIREYQALAPDEREWRLRATELRWYLTPLLRTPPSERAPGLARVPQELRELAQSRLTQWDLLPPNLQQEFLANEKTLHVFAQPVGASTNAEQQKIVEQFKQFLDLTPAEKQQILGTLSEGERAQMEKTLQTFEQLPPKQRALCVRNYAKFAGMTSAERAEFLKNAESWARMSPQERQTWRDLVAHVPLWPTPAPMTPPPAIMPPHLPPRIPKPAMATN